MEPSVRQEVGVQDEDCAGDLDWGQTWEDHAQWIAAAWILTTTNGQCRNAPAHDVHGLEDVQLENHNSKFTDAGLNAVTKGKGIEKGHRFQD